MKALLFRLLCLLGIHEMVATRIWKPHLYQRWHTFAGADERCVHCGYVVLWNRDDGMGRATEQHPNDICPCTLCRQMRGARCVH